MEAKRTVLRVGELALLAMLVAGCLSTQPEKGEPLSFTARAVAAAEAARVVRVVDADTYILLAGSSTYRFRLLGVEAPEHDQPFGPQAADSVARLLPGRDRYAGQPFTVLLADGRTATGLFTEGSYGIDV